MHPYLVLGQAFLVLGLIPCCWDNTGNCSPFIYRSYAEDVQRNLRQTLRSDEKPDYAHLRKLFRRLFDRKGYGRDFKYGHTRLLHSLKTLAGGDEGRSLHSLRTIAGVEEGRFLQSLRTVAGGEEGVSLEDLRTLLRSYPS